MQENLQQEKRSAQEVDYVLMHRLLSPVQSAMLILQARCLLCQIMAHRVGCNTSHLTGTGCHASRCGHPSYGCCTMLIVGVVASVRMHHTGFCICTNTC